MCIDYLVPFFNVFKSSPISFDQNFPKKNKRGLECKKVVAIGSHETSLIGWPTREAGGCYFVFPWHSFVWIFCMYYLYLCAFLLGSTDIFHLCL